MKEEYDLDSDALHHELKDHILSEFGKSEWLIKHSMPTILTSEVKRTIGVE